jgi:hypothetical protein
MPTTTTTTTTTTTPTTTTTTTTSSQISKPPALTSPEEDFDISNFVDGIVEKDKQLGIKPTAAGALDISAGYNEGGSKRLCPTDKLKFDA